MKAEHSIEQILLHYLKEEAPVFVAIVDREGAILDSNRFVRKLAGLGAAPRRLQDVLVDFRGRLDLPELAEDNGRAHLFHVTTFTGLPEAFFFQVFRLGERFVVLGKSDAAEQQRLRSSLVLLNNDLHNLTRDLQKRTAELARSNELKNQFLGMATHDLRKPLSAVLGYSHILLAGAEGELNPKQRQFLEQLRSSGELMQQIVEDFLDMAVIESGKLRLEWKPVDLAALIRGSIAQNAPLAQERHVAVALGFTEPLPPVRLDRTLIQQALNNLLSNALEHSPANGRVEIGVTRSDRAVNVMVRDEGPGIRPEELAGLFQPFGKSRAHKSSGEKSTGLGLVIVKKIVEAHRGRLWIDGRPEGGTVFGFALPCEAEA